MRPTCNYSSLQEPVLFDRHAVGGEYGAGWKAVGAGKLVTTFFPDDDRCGAVRVWENEQWG